MHSARPSALSVRAAKSETRNPKLEPGRPALSNFVLRISDFPARWLSSLLPRLSPLCMPKPAKLALVDGTVFTGTAFGADGEAFGEVCFNTSMTGYQEILTDPSYNGQIVAMTYPQIGNYGVNADDVESGKLAIKGFIVRELCHEPSNYRSTESLGDYLKRNNVVGIEGIDTRSLVRKLRVKGSMTGVISTVDLDDASLIAKAQRSPDLIGRDLVKEVMPKRPGTGVPPCISWPPSSLRSRQGCRRYRAARRGDRLRHEVEHPRHLKQMGCRVTVVPGTSTAAEVLALKPGRSLSVQRPGDPRPLTYAVDTIKGLLGKKPIFGICLGHQLLGLALGGEIYKLKFGHRGANQPVLDKTSGKVEITARTTASPSSPKRCPATWK